MIVKYSSALPPPLFSETYIDLKSPLYNNKLGANDLFIGGFSIIWLIKLKICIKCSMFHHYCIVFTLHRGANMCKKIVAIVNFLASQHFSFRGKNSWIKDNDLLLFLI